MKRQDLYPHARTYGAIIRDRRQHQGMKLKELAVRTGLSYQYLSNVERGEVNTPIETLVKICEALGLVMPGTPCLHASPAACADDHPPITMCTTRVLVCA